MAMKVAGLILALTGMIYFGIGVLAGRDDSQVVLLMGFGMLVFGTALYLAGATQEFFEKRECESDLERNRKDQRG